MMTGRKKRQQRNIMSDSTQNRLGLAFMSPWLIGFALFTLFPFVMSIVLSFMFVESSVIGYELIWNGLENFNIALFKNLDFVPALVEYLVMLITYTPTIVVVSFVLAYFLNMPIKGRALFRTVYFLSVVVLSGPVMYKIMNVGGGSNSVSLDGIFAFRIVNYYSPAIGHAVGKLFENFSIILWFTGIPIVLFINGLQKINPSLLEAAQIDSANAWQILFRIILPNVKSIALLVCIFTISQLGTFAINPVYDLITTAMQNTSNGMGQASAYAWIYTLVTLMVVGLALLLLRNKETVVKATVRRRKDGKYYAQ